MRFLKKIDSTVAAHLDLHLIVDNYTLFCGAAAQKLFSEAWTMRGRLLFWCVVLVLLGFFFQVLGSWPQGVLGFRHC